MNESDYPFPVSQLLTLGELEDGIASFSREWPDYLALGLGPEHVDDLIRMALDNALHDALGESPEVWAPVHAWRALGQLHAEAAAEPLAPLFDRVEGEGDDAVFEELPVVYGMIGPAAIPVLARYLADPRHREFDRVAAGHGLSEIGTRHPQARDECVTVLAGQLAHWAEQDPSLNALLISHLLDLRAVEQAPLMQQAFEAGKVDISVAGDWEDVQVELGLLDHRLTPRPQYISLPGLLSPALREDILWAGAPGERARQREEKRKKKAKRKQAQASRKRNRKRR